MTGRPRSRNKVQETIMAKGQVRSNRETRKPKKKDAAAPAAPVLMAKGLTEPASSKKKG
jgi:hypothetical protein